MCGIAGAIDLQADRVFDSARLACMARALHHRGPDGTRAYAAPGIALTTARLSVVGGVTGLQPYWDEATGICVSVNGELFNHHGLRSELLAQGHAVATGADTLVWPALYRQYGVDALLRAHGQFAVALWDRSNATLLLARDRVGICPLYYAEVDGWLLWASEAKALLASGLIEPRADRQGIDHFFTLFAQAQQRTCFEGISSLGAGEYLRVRRGSITRRRYFELEFPDRSEDIDSPSAADEARVVDRATDLLRTAVRRRLAADVPVASYLSGGLDSTLMLGLAATETRGAIEAFTLGLHGAGPAEQSVAAETAQALGVQHRVVHVCGADILATLPRAVLAAESPIVDMANPCALLLAERVAGSGFKATLTGEGADEALAGYVWYRIGALSERADRWFPGLPALLRRGLGPLLAPGTSPLGNGPLAGLRPSQFDAYEAMNRAKQLFYSAQMQSAAEGNDPFAELQADVERISAWHPRNQDLYLDYRVMLAGHLLIGKGDRVAMHNALELRFPYLDEEFVQFCAALPVHYKLRGMNGKWLLRQVAKRVLPGPLSQRPKGMFKAKSLCALGPLPSYCEQLLSPESLRKTGYFCPRKLQHERRLQRWLPALAPRRYVADAAFSAVVTTQLWHHLYLGGGLCELPTFDAGTVPPSSVLENIAMEAA